MHPVIRASSQFCQMVASQHPVQAVRYLQACAEETDNPGLFIFNVVGALVATMSAALGGKTAVSLAEETELAEPEIMAYLAAVDAGDLRAAVTAWNALSDEQGTSILMGAAEGLTIAYEAATGQKVMAMCVNPTCPIHGPARAN